MTNLNQTLIMADDAPYFEQEETDPIIELWPVRAVGDSLPSAIDLLNKLRTCRVDEFNPVKFRFLESLIVKSEGFPDGVVERVLVKFNRAVNGYRQDFLNARNHAGRQLESVRTDFPESVGAAQTLFDSGQFYKLTAYITRLQRIKYSKPDPLKNLLGILENQSSRAVGMSPNGIPEWAAGAQPVKKDGAQVGSVVDTTVARESQPELRVLRELRESWARLNAEKLVMRSVNEGPENAGPLNPHYLVIRSLSNMRDLSPHYLNRFVSYMETLLWLDESANKKNGARRKKATEK